MRKVHVKNDILVSQSHPRRNLRPWDDRGLLSLSNIEMLIYSSDIYWYGHWLSTVWNTGFDCVLTASTPASVTNLHYGTISCWSKQINSLIDLKNQRQAFKHLHWNQHASTKISRFDLLGCSSGLDSAPQFSSTHSSSTLMVACIQIQLIQSIF